MEGVVVVRLEVPTGLEAWALLEMSGECLVAHLAVLLALLITVPTLVEVRPLVLELVAAFMEITIRMQLDSLTSELSPSCVNYILTDSVILTVVVM